MQMRVLQISCCSDDKVRGFGVTDLADMLQSLGIAERLT